MSNNNVLATTQYVLNKSIIEFANFLHFCKVTNVSFQKDFLDKEYAPGATINYRLPNNFRAGNTLDITGSIQAIQDRYRPLTITQTINVPMAIDSTEFTLNLQKDQVVFERDIIPAMRVLAENAETFIASKILTANRFVGIPGTPLNKTSIDTACANLTQHGVAMDNRYTALTVMDAVNVKSSLTTILDKDIVDPVLREGYIGRLFDTAVFQTTKTGRHVSGTGVDNTPSGLGLIAAGTTVGTTSSGSTLSLTGFPHSTSGIFQTNDLIQITDVNGVSLGVNSLNFSDLTDTGLAAQFTVLPFNPSSPSTPYSSDSSGNVTINISPAIITDTTSPYQNLTIPIPPSTPVSLLASHNVNYVFQRDGIVFAAPKLERLETFDTVYAIHKNYKNFVLRYTRGGDIYKSQNVNRVDMILGANVNPEYIVRLVS